MPQPLAILFLLMLIASALVDATCGMAQDSPAVDTGLSDEVQLIEDLNRFIESDEIMLDERDIRIHEPLGEFDKVLNTVFGQHAGRHHGVHASFDFMIGQRMLESSTYDFLFENAGFRVRLTNALKSDVLGFTDWEASVHWLRSETFELNQVSVFSNILETNFTSLNPGQQASEFLEIDRWERRGDQPFASTELNLTRKLGTASNPRWSLTQLAGLRYLYNAEGYDTVFGGATYINPVDSNTTNSPIAMRPVSGLDISNHMLGFQMGYGGQWTADKFQFSARLVGGLLGNYASTENWNYSGTSTTLGSLLTPGSTTLDPIRIETSDDSFRISSMVEADLSLVYRVAESIDLNLGAYAIHLAGQGVGDTADLFNSSDDLALVGLRFGASYRR